MTNERQQQLEDLNREQGVGVENLGTRAAYDDLIGALDIERRYPFAGEEDAAALRAAAGFFEHVVDIGGYFEDEAMRMAVQTRAWHAQEVAGQMAERAEELGS
jgi:hypothetical protein